MPSSSSAVAVHRPNLTSNEPAGRECQRSHWVSKHKGQCSMLAEEQYKTMLSRWTGDSGAGPLQVLENAIVS